jgi:hypothetical protein
MLGYAIFRLLSVSETFLSLFVHSMLILYFNTQCLYSEHVLGEGHPPPDPLPLELWSMLMYYVYLINAYTIL